jgi:hypothetical protein
VEFLALAVVFNSHVHLGFYNFLAGLVSYLFALGYWLRLRKREGSASGWGAMAALVTLTYFCHPVPLVELWITMTLLWACGAVRERKWRAAEARLAAAVSMPAVALYIHYLLTSPSGTGVPTSWPTLRYSASLLVRLLPLATYTPEEKLVALLFSAIVALATVWAWRTKRMRTTNDYLYVSAALAGLVFVAPTQAAGGTLITPRLVYFPLFLLLVWLASLDWPRRMAPACAAAGIGLALMGLAARWPIYQRYDQRIAGFLNLAADRPASIVDFFQSASNASTADLDAGGTPHLPPGVWGYVAARKRGILLSDYEPTLAYFPFRFRPGVSPWPYVIDPPAGCALQGQLIDEARYRRGSGLQVDAQIMWIDDASRVRESCVRRYAPGIVSVKSADGGRLLWIAGAD